VTDPRLERWVESVVSTPGLTGARTFEEAWKLHVEDSLAALDLIDAGPVVDVGSGGGSPGIPLAVMRPQLRFVLLESAARKCAFLHQAARSFENVEVVCERAEEHARTLGRDFYAIAVARALAPPPVAVEWCLPLVAVGGRLVLFAGSPSETAGSTALALGGSPPRVVPVPGSEGKCLLVFEKRAPTPPRFPRRAGVARKRPLT
jgi:16S rRNA (guanine527-N7)-methyltransferase